MSVIAHWSRSFPEAGLTSSIARIVGQSIEWRVVIAVAVNPRTCVSRLQKLITDSLGHQSWARPPGKIIAAHLMRGLTLTRVRA